MQLLEISYKKEIKIGTFENLTYMVLGALQNIALAGDINFKEVKRSVKAFKKAHLNEYENIKYLQLEIERIESQFYMNKIKSYTLKDVKKKLRLIE